MQLENAWKEGGLHPERSRGRRMLLDRCGERAVGLLYVHPLIVGWQPPPTIIGSRTYWLQRQPLFSHPFQSFPGGKGTEVALRGISPYPLLDRKVIAVFAIPSSPGMAGASALCSGPGKKKRPPIFTVVCAKWLCFQFSIPVKDSPKNTFIWLSCRIPRRLSRHRAGGSFSIFQTKFKVNLVLICASRALPPKRITNRMR